MAFRGKGVVEVVLRKEDTFALGNKALATSNYKTFRAFERISWFPPYSRINTIKPCMTSLN